MVKRLFKSEAEYKKAARSLKKLLGNDFKLDARKKLTPQSKRLITRQYKQYRPDSINAKRYNEIKGYLTPDMQKELNPKKQNNYRKMQLRDYHNTIKQLKRRQHIEYKSDSPSRLKAAQQFGQHPDSLKGLNVAFIPYTTQERPRVSFNSKGEMILNTKYERSKVISFDELRLETGGKDYVQSLVDQNPAFDNFVIHAGDNFISQAQSRELVAEKIEDLMEQYSDDDKNNFYGNWLGGMTARKFKKQKPIKDAKKAIAKAKAKKKAKAKRKAKRK